MDLFKKAMHERGLVKERYWYEESDPKKKFPNKAKGVRQVARRKLKTDLRKEINATEVERFIQ